MMRDTLVGFCRNFGGIFKMQRFSLFISGCQCQNTLGMLLRGPRIGNSIHHVIGLKFACFFRLFSVRQPVRITDTDTLPFLVKIVGF